MALADSLISLAGTAIKQNPEMLTKLASTLAGSQGADFLKKLMENPALKEVAAKLVTTEAFQKFVVSLAGTAVGKTIITNGMQFVVTQQMQNGLQSALSSLLGGQQSTSPTQTANTNSAANLTGQIAMSVLGNILSGKK